MNNEKKELNLDEMAMVNGGEAGEEGGVDQEEGEEMEKPEIDPNALYNIYKKIELDLSKKEKNLKEYFVLYIPDTFSSYVSFRFPFCRFEGRLP